MKFNKHQVASFLRSDLDFYDELYFIGCLTNRTWIQVLEIILMEQFVYEIKYRINLSVRITND